MNFLDRFNLRPNERRLVVLIGIVLFVLLNVWFVRPQFSDWTPTQVALEKARKKLIEMQTEIDNASQYKKQIEKLQGQGGALLAEEAAVQLRRNIDNQVMQSGIVPNGVNDQQPRTTPESIFEERAVTMGFVNTGEKELVDFLFNISKERSTIRVRDLSVRPDPQLQRLQGSMTLIASYQKKTAQKLAKPAAAQKPAASVPAKKESKTEPKLPPPTLKSPPQKKDKPAPVPVKPKPSSAEIERSPLRERSSTKEP